ncbi:MAG: LysR family transcriptional regulator [Pseudomonadota bacterium]
MSKASEVAFLKVVELGSIRAASRALGQDASGISRRITGLEKRLGTKLLNRHGNATAATAKGQVYYERLSSIMDQLAALETEISGEDLVPSGLLRVTAPIDFGQEHVAKWLLQYKRMYPKVEFDLILANDFLDLNQSQIDVAVRVGTLPDSSLIARKLADAPQAIVASPEYLKRMGMPEHPKELQAHDHVFFSAGSRQQHLELIAPGGSMLRISRLHGIAINSVRSAVNAVTNGLGIYSGPLWAVAEEIARGNLVQVLAGYHQNQLPLYAVRQPATVLPARIATFILHVSERILSVGGLNAVNLTSGHRQFSKPSGHRRSDDGHD